MFREKAILTHLLIFPSLPPPFPHPLSCPTPKALWFCLSFTWFYGVGGFDCVSVKWEDEVGG
jgi:hypothetical protein